MANTNSKIVLGDGTVILDISTDTVKADKVLKDYTFHTNDGSPDVGTCTFNADTRDTTAEADEVLENEYFYGANGQRQRGTMPNRGAQTGSISTKNGTVNIQQGYHDGSGSIGIAETEKRKIIPGNIKAGVSILGEVGEYGGEIVTAEKLTVTPSFSDQTKVPTTTDYFSEVLVKAIPVSYVPNASGGNTVTIG